MSARIYEILTADYTATAPQPVTAHIIADTVSDLPAKTAFSGYTLQAGSFADVVQPARRYMIDSAGAWFQQLHDVGADTYTQSQIDNMLAAKQDTLTPGVNMDTTPTQNSVNAATSGGIYTAIALSNFLRVGEQIPEEQAPGVYNSLDLYFTPGVFYVGSATHAGHITNCPIAAAGKVIVMPLWSSTRLIQIYISVDLGVPRIHIRRCYVNSGTPTFMQWYQFEGTAI